MGKISPARVVTAIVTGGFSELYRPVAKQSKVAGAVLNPQSAAVEQGVKAGVKATTVPELPESPLVESPPEKDTAAVQQASSEAARRRARARGFRSTLLGGRDTILGGLLTSGPNEGRQQTLGS